MVQIRPNDLIAVESRGSFFLFAVLTKQILFGGNWVFVFHRDHATLPTRDLRYDGAPIAGFNAAVDFYHPNRENRVHRVSRQNDFHALRGPELLQGEPLPDETHYQILQWHNGVRERAELLRCTLSPTLLERASPHYTCFQADFACELARRAWTPSRQLYGPDGLAEEVAQALHYSSAINAAGHNDSSREPAPSPSPQAVIAAWQR